MKNEPYKPSIATIFRKSPNTAQFRSEMINTGGNFSLTSDDIIELGVAYLERFPGCYGNEECDDVRDAYEVAKICTIEYLIANFNEDIKAILRAGFSQVDTIAHASRELKRITKPEMFLNILNTLSTRSETLHDIVKTVPPSIIRERFSGALAFASNVIYLLGIDGGIA
ncbi:MAG: hypothetical protein N2316_06155 [Spirochaetes bacterium]|nr:hypothetical protein [Spirochaetota bacterium]